MRLERLPTLRGIDRAFRGIAGVAAVRVAWPRLVQALDEGHREAIALDCDTAHLSIGLAATYAATDSDLCCSALHNWAATLPTLVGERS